MAEVVTFGEIMLRLSTPGFERYTQTTSFDAVYGGAEANVAQSLANYGADAGFVTLLPENHLGDACIRQLRSFGVDTSGIVLKDGRIGIYFVEKGAMQRPSNVIYDRSHSCIAEASGDDIDWHEALHGAQWFHWTGITPALSAGASELCIEATRVAQELGMTVSCDLNYRSKLWKWGKEPDEVMTELVSNTDISIGNEEDADKVFGIRAPHSDVEAGEVDAEDYRYVAEKLMGRFPNLKKVAITLRGSISASHNTWTAVLFDGEELYKTDTYDLTHIVDRVGGGDSFAGGLIYSFLNDADDQDALDFAVAAGCLKHSIPGDANLATREEVKSLVQQGGSGRVQR
ncbi:MAG: PfkB family carbohydrate kinase [Candidatus Brocadiia bacterium]